MKQFPPCTRLLDDLQNGGWVSQGDRGRITNSRCMAKQAAISQMKNFLYVTKSAGAVAAIPRRWIAECSQAEESHLY